MKNKIEVSFMSNSTKLENNKDIEYVKKKEKNIFLEILNDYFQTSTIHGMSYLGAKDKSLTEKIWWVMMFMLSVAACSYLITKTWIKWKTNPVILSFEKEQVPLWEIPFPAVTICPINKVEQTTYNYTEIFRDKHTEFTAEQVKTFWDISLVCKLRDSFGDDIEYPTDHNFTDELAIENIRMVAPSLDGTIFGTIWHNNVEKGLFAERLTEEGLCFTFNSLSQEDMYTKEINHNIVYINHSVSNQGWTMEDGYLSEVSFNTHPRRTAKDGLVFGITVILRTVLNNIDWVCGSAMSGYKIILHNPAEPPKAAQHYFLVPLNRQMALVVRPELTRTDKAVRSLSIQARKCYFSGEKILSLFKIYTQNNCKLECYANITNYYCGCVPFYIPHDNNTRICGFSKTKCIQESQSIILDLETILDFSELYDKYGLKARFISDIFLECSCLPSCTTLDYTAETSHTEFHMVDSVLASGSFDNKISEEEFELLKAGLVSATKVDIFFKESQFLALQRSELFGQTDFFSNCGGLLGLFMGFSLLSGLEIIYFLTIRLWIKFRNRRKNK